MKVYRVNFTSTDDGDRGFEFFPTENGAKNVAMKFEDKQDGNVAEVETIEFAPTKAGVLRLLNKYAIHPDNG